MQNQKKPSAIMWELKIETIDKKPLPPAIRQIIMKSFQLVTTNLTSMGITRNVGKILLTQVENKKVAIEVVKDLPTIKKIAGNNGN